MLAIITERAKVEDHIEEVVPHLVDGDLSILNTLMIRLYLWNMTLRKQKKK
jgi:hypothetical protein